MTRNQKIALGCGGAGCLGLIVVVIAACLIYFLVYRSPARASRNHNYNISIDDNAPNSNSNTSSNSNSDSNSNSASTSVSSMSEDDKHKLFQAAATTGDSELINRVNVKIGILNDDFTPGEHYREFLADHISWGARNYDFIQSINTPEKARAYVNDHFPE